MGFLVLGFPDLGQRLSEDSAAGCGIEVLGGAPKP